MTNDLNGDDMSIIKCDQCRDGYLIVKVGKDVNTEKNVAFLGCTNYTDDKKGCNRTMSYKEYKKLM